MTDDTNEYQRDENTRRALLELFQGTGYTVRIVGTDGTYTITPLTEGVTLCTGEAVTVTHEDLVAKGIYEVVGEIVRNWDAR